ncbi:hypothetical protein KIW84_070161, partial [Lathyrus oleraceus]
YIVFVDALLCYLGLLTYATYYLIFCSMFPFLSPTYFIHFIWLPKYIKLLVFIQVATGQIASTGMALLSYVQKVSDKVSLATDLMCNFNSMSRDVTASFGYDYILRQCRLRGKVDSNGVCAAFLEERLNMGLNFILSAELDHKKKDYKFGFGLTVGE